MSVTGRRVRSSDQIPAGGYLWPNVCERTGGFTDGYFAIPDGLVTLLMISIAALCVLCVYGNPISSRAAWQCGENAATGGMSDGIDCANARTALITRAG